MMGTLQLNSGSIMLVFLVLYGLHRLISFLWWRPKRTQKLFRSQGIKGPSYKLLLGNLKDLAQIKQQHKSQTQKGVATSKHDIVSGIMPHINVWRKKYGSVYLYWFGTSPRLVLMEPELIREMTVTKSKHFVKNITNPYLNEMLGNSVVIINGEVWESHRKILNPFFNLESLKGMVPIVVRITKEMVNRWKDSATCGTREIEVQKDLRALTGDVIARTAFGDEFKQAHAIFELLLEQSKMNAQAMRTFYIPGSWYLPTPFNRKYKRLNKEGDRLFKELIEGQDIGLSQQYGILELMLSENRKAKSMSTQDIIDECKTFFAAGYSTTSLLLSWATMLLGMYTEWQERAREEVRDVLDGGPPTFENLNRLKTLNMILNETLRLYSPATLTMRKANEETKLGNLTVPAGTVVEVPIIAIHHEPEQWGDDVHQFNPGRFKDGVSKASKHPMAFMPFGHGPTMCMGMNFAMIESKSALAIILQNFSFVISPTYKHSPQCGVTLGPEHGVHIILSKI